MCFIPTSPEPSQRFLALDAQRKKVFSGPSNQAFNDLIDRRNAAELVKLRGARDASKKTSTTATPTKKATPTDSGAGKNTLLTDTSGLAKKTLLGV